MPVSAHRQSCFLGTPATLHSCPNRIQRASTGPVQAGIVGPGKRWEHYKLNHNKKPVRHDVHVRSGDTVVVIGGKDKGKVGKVDKVMPKTAQIVVEGINLRLKFRPPVSEGEQGSYFQKESPIHHSNVMHWSNSQNVRSRLAHKVDEAGKKVRYLVKTGEVIPDVIKPREAKPEEKPEETSE
ncbi:hypothetical protein WJX84_009234 [Apatococcus fuscideae]|uniref:KOW domain-containing protein n=1 Tax=Apatococcus fuscideae TaxID=2026836 RepID=A0AAW1RLP8_9CHLO